MDLLWIIAAGLILAYVIRIFTYRAGWFKLDGKETTKDGAGHSKSSDPGHQVPFVSVLVPVRNEEAGIENLISDLADQDYPSGNFELIVIDDHSDDATAELVQSAGDRYPWLKLITLPQGEYGKKAALRKGIMTAGGDLILGTDGDCRVPGGWISAMMAGFSDPAIRMVISAVILDPDRPLFNAFQSLEFFSHTAVAAGSAGIGRPILCNAANMAYYKKDYLRFLQEGGYASESGDDVFFLLWMKKEYSSPVRFNASGDAAVRSTPERGPVSFFRQRLRWASKGMEYRDPNILSTAILIFGVNAFLLAVLIMGLPLVTGDRHWTFLCAFGITLTVKSLSDLFLLTPVLRHYRKARLLRHFIPLGIIYFLYVSFTGMAGQVFRVSWKGRKMKRNRFNYKDVDRRS
jgi:glycosyltransferase involved in cell wall biosynthesis